MRKQIKRIISLVSIVALVAVVATGYRFPVKSTTVRAVGDLAVDWGVPDGDPIFVVTNMVPGQMEPRSVDVTNNAGTARPVGIRGILDSETAGFSGVLDIVISEGVTDLYGGTSPTGEKTLADFFADSTSPDGIPLSTLGPSASTTYDIKVTFDEEAGNPFQGANIQFDLIIGIAVEVPDECEDIVFSGDPIFGTDGNDRIRGTSGNDLIFGFEGNDRIFGHGGDDCIVGNEGNDELRGETGDDIIFGNEGDDLVIGAVGKDLLFGGEGNDTMRGENNDDVMEGGSGNDTMTGGNGNDVMRGNDGNDKMLGENGNDTIFGDSGDDEIDGGNGADIVEGGSGNDTMNGKNGNDTLIGGSDTDSANGSNGTDTCDAEVEVNCEL